MTERTITIPLETFERLVLLLDASLPALDAAADRERHSERGKTLRQVTEQDRATNIRQFVRTTGQLLPNGWARDALGLGDAADQDE